MNVWHDDALLVIMPNALFFSAFFKKVMAESDNFVVYSKIACKRLGDVVILWK